MALYYADLSNAWYSERVPGLNDALAAEGWQRLSWCENADWEQGSWMGPDHPERCTASLFLARLVFQLPPTTRRVLVVGDNTLSQHLREDWPNGAIWYNWADRERFLTESGAPPGSAMWNIPGDRCAGIAEQLRRALNWAESPYDAILLVGGWNAKWGDPLELADLVTSATR